MIAPIQDASTSETGPEARGESSDCNTGRYGESHPRMQPCDRVIKLAVDFKQFFITLQFVHYVGQLSTTYDGKELMFDLAERSICRQNRLLNHCVISFVYL